MTNEEAKKLIDRWVVITLIEGGISLSESTRQALDMAIKALDSCGDAISRDAVLDACSQSINILDAMSRIEDLPSVTPKQRTGHWIEEDGYNGDTYYDCSVCGESWTTIDGTPWDNDMKYCPNCGTPMVEPQESEG